MARILLLLALAALTQANTLDLNPINWVFKAPQLGLEFASGVVGQVQDGFNKAGLGAITTGPLNAVKAGFDVPASMVDQVKEKATDVASIIGDLASLPQKIADRATSPPSADEKRISEALQPIQTKKTPTVKPSTATAAEVAAMKTDVDKRFGVIVSTILFYFEDLEDHSGASADDIEFIREETMHVLQRANELMAYVNAAQTPEQILLIVDDINSDFGPLFDEARMHLAGDEH